MRVSEFHRRFTSLIAALVILLVAVAPTLGQVLASATGSQWIEVCTVQGSKWIQADEDGTEGAPSSAHLLEHCPYCTLHAPALGLPPASALAHLPLQLSHAVPLAFLSAPHTLHAWVTAQSRAPPRFS